MADTVVEATPGDENDDTWLYGESTGEQISDKSQEEGDKAPQTDAERGNEGEDKEQEDQTNDDSHFDEHFEDVSQDEAPNGDADSQGNGDSDSDDSDNIKVTIGEIKSGPQAYGSLNIKRGVGLVAAGPTEKPRPATTTGKVSLEDLDGPGSINGVPALEFNIDTIEDKPWNKPGADISDYFNYGFNEVTWSAYCDRQRRMRVNEAGVGLHSGPPQRAPTQEMRRPPPQAGPPRNDMEMPPPMHMQNNNFQVRENTIQVMTAERREYGRGNVIGRDMPPPGEYFGAPPPPDHYYAPPHAHYDEPWGRHPEPGWAPTDIKELTPGPGAMGPPPGPPAHLGLGPPPAHLAPHMLPAPPYAPPYRAPLAPPDRDRDRAREHDRERSERRERDRREEEERERDRERDRDRDRERERSRSIKPERTREKSYRRERSRSRSRRHKSRSRSPRPRERSRDRERSRERERERSRERDRSRDRERSVKPKKDKDKDDK